MLQNNNPGNPGRRIAQHLQPSLIDQKTHTFPSPPHISERLLVHFLFPSVALRVKGGGICCCSLICIPGWWGNSSLGLPLTADPYPSQTAGLHFHYPACFTAPYNRTQHSPEQELACQKNKSPVERTVFPISGLRWRRTCTVPPPPPVVSFLYGPTAHPYADG